MAYAILFFAVESIGKLLTEEANFLQGVSDQVNQLHDDLKQMQLFLNAAATKRSVRESVQAWISAIAYEANDLVEDYVFRVASQNKEGLTNTLKKCACFFSERQTHHNLGKEIQSLRNRISELTKKFGDYDVPTIIEGEGSSSMQQQLRRTYSFFSKSEEDVVGLESDVNLLVKYLVNEDGFGHKSMVSICGMGGIGKTTLAKKVYHHPRVRREFQGFAWFCISQQRSPKEILQGILVELIPEQKVQIMQSGEEMLVEQLREVLQRRRCLVILDDIWSNDAWDCIKSAFCISENGSKILLTTRNGHVAEYVDPNGYHHHPRFLTNEESWDLLKKKSLKNRSTLDDEDYHKLEELGKAMVKCCGGLPLAIVVLGGILETKESPKDWSIVLDNVKSYIGRGENIGQAEGKVTNILAFSYYDLPHMLQPCFLYLGKFKEDSNIEVERLYQLWIAEGMVFAIDRRVQETMMDVAERYLEELAKRCMVEVELHEEGQPTITRFKSCRLRDLMRDLCLDKAKDENLYKVINIDHPNIGIPSTNSSPAIERHYGFVIRGSLDDFTPSEEQTKHLQSFWCEPLDWDIIDICDGSRIMSQVKNFKMLRVLIIESYEMEQVGSLPRRRYSKSIIECIGHLIHLRCLSLRNSEFFELPSSLGNLNYLETLDLRGIECSRITVELWKLCRLKHLYLPYSNHILRLDRLGKQIEILETVDNIDYNLKDLPILANLRALKVRVYDNLHDLERIIRYISRLNYIRFTSLVIRDCDFEIDSNSDSKNGLAVFEQVLFCRNLHELLIANTLCKRLPNYQPLLFPSPGLTELTLWGSKTEEDPMPTLEKFPNLLKLVLLRNSFVGKEMTCHAMGFPQLNVLCLIGLKNLEEWKVDEGAMPKLSTLKIWECEKLEMIPDGLRSIYTLKELDLRLMPEGFKNRVQTVNGEKGPDFDKICHVPSVILINQNPSEARKASVQVKIKQGKMRLCDNCSRTITPFK